MYSRIQGLNHGRSTQAVMDHMPAIFLSLCLCTGLSACGQGSLHPLTGSEAQALVASEDTAADAAASLKDKGATDYGHVLGAQITLMDIREPDLPLCSSESAYSTAESALPTAQLSPACEERVTLLPGNSLLLLESDSGMAQDRDFNRLKDLVPRRVAGKTHLILSKQQFLHHQWRFSALGEALYQSVWPWLSANTAAGDEQRYADTQYWLNTLGAHYVQSDLNADGQIDYLDALRWSPLEHASWSSAERIDAVYESIYRSADKSSLPFDDAVLLANYAYRSRVDYVGFEKGIAALVGPYNLHLVDLSDLEHPRAVSNFPVPAIEDALLHQGKLYLALGDKGLWVVDISAADRPELIAQFPTPAHFLALDDEGGDVYFLAARATEIALGQITQNTAAIDAEWLVRESGRFQHITHFVVSDQRFFFAGIDRTIYALSQHDGQWTTVSKNLSAYRLFNFDVVINDMAVTADNLYLSLVSAINRKLSWKEKQYFAVPGLMEISLDDELKLGNESLYSEIKADLIWAAGQHLVVLQAGAFQRYMAGGILLAETNNYSALSEETRFAATAENTLTNALAGTSARNILSDLGKRSHRLVMDETSMQVLYYRENQGLLVYPGTQVPLGEGLVRANGPVVGALVEVFPYRAGDIPQTLQQESLCSAISDDGEPVEQGFLLNERLPMFGAVKFSADCVLGPGDYLLRASGGADIDFNSDNVRDAEARNLQGSLYAILSYEQLLDPDGWDIDVASTKIALQAPAGTALLSPDQFYPVGGQVLGLDYLKTVLGIDDLYLTLRDGNNEPVRVNGDGVFVFPDLKANDAVYEVSIVQQPGGVVCHVREGTGKVSGFPVDHIRVECPQPGILSVIPDTVTVGDEVKISGLNLSNITPVLAGHTLNLTFQGENEVRFVVPDLVEDGDYRLAIDGVSESPLISFSSEPLPDRRNWRNYNEYFAVSGLHDVIQLQMDNNSWACALTRYQRVYCWSWQYSDPQIIELSEFRGATGIYQGFGELCVMDDCGKMMCNNLEGYMTNLKLDSTQATSTNEINSADIGFSSNKLCDQAAIEANSDREQILAIQFAKSHMPEDYPNIEKAKYVGAGEGYFCALLDTGRVECWGRNEMGQLGNGTMDFQRQVFGNVVGVRSADILSVGFRNACVLESDNDVKCWGQHIFGDSAYPLYLTSAQKLPNLRKIKDIQSGGVASCAIKNDSGLLCWGPYFAASETPGELWKVIGPRYVEEVGSVKSVAIGVYGMCFSTEVGNVLCR